MGKRGVLLVLLSIVVLVLAGCPTPGPGGNSVYGSILAFQWAITTPVSVSLANGMMSYTAQAAVNTGILVDQYGSFLIQDVPSGTYTLTLSFTATNGSTGVPQYSLNGGAWTAGDSTTGGGASPWTITFNGIVINGTAAISVDLGNGAS